MKRKFCYLLVAAMLVCGTGTLQAQKRSADGVTIGGATWATSNVDAKGKFAKNPWNPGRYYTFDEAQTVCPKGWRTPSATEYESLLRAENEWLTENNVNGRRYGTGDNSIFLPAAGGRYTYQKELADVGGTGYYWTSVAYSGADLDYKPQLEHNGHLAYNFRFGAGGGSPVYHHNRDFGFSVRCVKQ